MHCTCKGALGLERLLPVPHPPIRAWTFVSLLILLVSVEAGASITFEADSLLLRERNIAPIGPIPQPAEADSHVAATPEASENAANLYSEAYWAAVADLDLAGSLKAARNRPELEFAHGLTFLAGGDRERAQHSFADLSVGISDLNVAVAAQMMLAHTLMYDQKWALLRDLPASPALGVADQSNAMEIERWGHAFANIEPQSILFPAKPVSLPLRITAVGTPSLRVKINGREYTFWLDTGSSMTVLSSEVAAKTHSPVISDDTLTVRTFAGVAEVRAAMVRKLELGPIVLTNSPVIVMDDAMMRVKASGDGGPWANHRVDGIIGWDIIRQIDVLLDYQDRVVTLARPQRFGMVEGATPSLMWVGRPLIKVRGKRGETLHLALDTGAQATLLNATVLEKLGMTGRAVDAKVFGIAKTGSSTNRLISALTLDVAGRSIILENVIVYGPSYSGLIGCDGILGSDLAQFGSLHIDATNGIFSVG